MTQRGAEETAASSGAKALADFPAASLLTNEAISMKTHKILFVMPEVLSRASRVSHEKGGLIPQMDSRLRGNDQ